MLPVSFPLSELKERARNNKNAFKKALYKAGSGSQADKSIALLHKEVFECTDCLACANCCRTTGPLFTNRDIDKLSRHLRMKPGSFMEKYLRLDEEGDYVLKTIPCPFLSADNYCSVYDYRPRACREYPHTDQPGQAGIAKLTIKNSAICPAVFSILEKLSKIK